MKKRNNQDVNEEIKMPQTPESTEEPEMEGFEYCSSAKQKCLTDCINNTSLITTLN